MQLAPASPAPTMVIRPGDDVSTLPGSTPAGEVVARYTKELFSLQGALSLAWTPSTKPTELRVAFETADLARMADAILRDTVRGVQLLLVDPDGKPWDLSGPGAPWSMNPINLARSIAAMPGIAGYDRAAKNVLKLVPVDQAQRQRLEALLNPVVAGMVLVWRGKCGGPGCPPEPPLP